MSKIDPPNDPAKDWNNLQSEIAATQEAGLLRKDEDIVVQGLDKTRNAGLMQRDEYERQKAARLAAAAGRGDKGGRRRRRRRKSKKKSRRRRKSKKKSRRRRKSKKSRRRRKSKKSRRRRRKRKVMKGGSSINYSVIDNSLKGENARILGSHSYTTSDNCGDAYNHYTGGKVKSLY